MLKRLIVLGASVRAAAQSALRAGWQPWAADMFADADLAACAPATAVHDYPEGLERAARSAPPGAWLYTGGLENHADLVDRIARRRRLWGNSGSVLREVRNPVLVGRALADAGLAAPEVRLAPEDVPQDGTWLRKPWRGCGGARIAVWRGPSKSASGRAPGNGDGWYFQRRVEGTACSAVYVAAGGQSRLLGITRQIIGAAWTGGERFQYSGSIALAAIDAESFLVGKAVPECAKHVGEVLARQFGLVGLFGVDGMALGPAFLPVEVNPRYPASVEVLERASDIAALGWHVEACQSGRLPQPPDPVPRACWGKAIVYAPEETLVPRELAHWASEANQGKRWPILADLPRPGTRIARGWPVLTVFAAGPDDRAVEQALCERAARVRAVLNSGSRGRG